MAKKSRPTFQKRDKEKAKEAEENTKDQRREIDARVAKIQAKLDAKRVRGYWLSIMARGDLKGQHVVGSCEGNTKKIVLNRSRDSQ